MRLTKSCIYKGNVGAGGVVGGGAEQRHLSWSHEKLD